MLSVLASPTNLKFTQRIHLLKTDAFRQVRRRVSIDEIHGNFRLRTIDSMNEFLQVMELRHRVFQKEFAAKRFCIRSDRDRFDTNADFIAVSDVKTNQIVGCYRVLMADHASDYYSSTEFSISPILQTPGKKLELSRSCIDPKYRTGSVIALLWRGLGHYLQQSGATYLFGMGSIQTTSSEQIAKMNDIFRNRGWMHSEIYCEAKPANKPNNIKSQQYAFSSAETSKIVEIPQLIRSYIRAGAKICSAPAVDWKFKCTDYLLLLDRKNLHPTFEKFS